MTSEPRIQRAIPHGAIIRPEHQRPVIAVIHWEHGGQEEVPAIATAWTREAVQITWEDGTEGSFRQDWVPAGDIRRKIHPHREPGRDQPGETRGRRE